MHAFWKNEKGGLANTCLITSVVLGGSKCSTWTVQHAFQKRNAWVFCRRGITFLCMFVHRAFKLLHKKKAKTSPETDSDVRLSPLDWAQCWANRYQAHHSPSSYLKEDRCACPPNRPWVFFVNHNLLNRAQADLLTVYTLFWKIKSKETRRSSRWKAGCNLPIEQRKKWSMGLADGQGSSTLTVGQRVRAISRWLMRRSVDGHEEGGVQRDTPKGMHDGGGSIHDWQRVKKSVFRRS
jgi:hypothetical protein